jgi:hypothetical protein
MSVQNCIKCGKPNNSELIKCIFCGANITTGSTSDSPESLYLGGDTAYYEEKFQRLRESDTNSWNFAAFYFTTYWLAYHKLYIWAIIALIFPFTAVFFPPLLIFSVFIKFLLGSSGNSIYMRHIERLSATYHTLPESKRAAHVRRHGGTSVPAVIVTVVFYCVCFYLLLSRLW